MARKLLSRDLDKVITKLKDFADYYGVSNTREYKDVDLMLSKWKVSCLVEESLTPKGQEIVYSVEIPDELLEFKVG